MIIQLILVPHDKITCIDSLIIYQLLYPNIISDLFLITNSWENSCWLIWASSSEKNNVNK